MRRAFILGSNGPTNAHPLRYTQVDAKRIQKCLRDVHCGFTVELARNRKNPWALRQQLSAAANACTTEDVFVCYFSGHGILRQGELFLLLDSTEIDNIFHKIQQLTYMMWPDLIWTDMGLIHVASLPDVI